MRPGPSIREAAERRIAQLEHDGIKQITSRAELKAMTPDQAQRARREGRLTGILAGLYGEPGPYRQHNAG